MQDTNVTAAGGSATAHLSFEQDDVTRGTVESEIAPLPTTPPAVSELLPSILDASAKCFVDRDRDYMAAAANSQGRHGSIGRVLADKKRQTTSSSQQVDNTSTRVSLSARPFASCCKLSLTVYVSL